MESEKIAVSGVGGGVGQSVIKALYETPVHAKFSVRRTGSYQGDESRKMSGGLHCLLHGKGSAGELGFTIVLHTFTR